ncbi:MAG: flavodoxin family protein [Novosphingobium sp.]|nr:flavodoxin family protein [Novosphingobium sp.]
MVGRSAIARCRTGRGNAKPSLVQLCDRLAVRKARAQSSTGYAHEGAGGRAELIGAAEAVPERLLSAHGYLFVCPENLASMSGAMKEMFDRMYYPLLGRIEGRPYATVIAAGSDGRGAQAQIDRIVAGWRLRRVAEPLIVNLNAQTPEAILAPKHVSEETLERCRQLGAGLAEGLAQGIF